MKINDGGPAFPHAPHYDYQGQLSKPSEPGMSLRDFFAGQASDEDIRDMQSCKPDGFISRQCARYMCADAMIKEREGTDQGETGKQKT
jgi:hypothetical protein